MHPLKLVCSQVRPDNLRLQLLVNGIPYTSLQENQTRYICLELATDEVSLESKIQDENAEVWKIDPQTISDAICQPQELAICPNDKLVIRFRLSALKMPTNRTETIYISHSLEQHSVETLSAIESTSNQQSTRKEQASSSAIFVRDKHEQPSSTIEPDTIEVQNKPQSGILDELAMQRQKIISELFNKLRIDKK